MNGLEALLFLFHIKLFKMSLEIVPLYQSNRSDSGTTMHNVDPVLKKPSV